VTHKWRHGIKAHAPVQGLGPVIGIVGDMAQAGRADEQQQPEGEKARAGCAADAKAPDAALVNRLHAGWSSLVALHCSMWHSAQLTSGQLPMHDTQRPKHRVCEPSWPDARALGLRSLPVARRTTAHDASQACMAGGARRGPCWRAALAAEVSYKDVR
jgi:hypothetical protein